MASKNTRWTLSRSKDLDAPLAQSTRSLMWRTCGRPRYNESMRDYAENSRKIALHSDTQKLSGTSTAKLTMQPDTLHSTSRARFTPFRQRTAISNCTETMRSDWPSGGGINSTQSRRSVDLNSPIEFQRLQYSNHRLIMSKESYTRDLQPFTAFPLMCRFLALLCLPVLMQADIPPVDYWTDEARAGWLAVAAHQEGASRLSLIQPDGTASLNLISPVWTTQGAVALHRLPYRVLPFSTWWHRYGALRELVDDTAGSTPKFQWVQDGDTARLQADPKDLAELPPQGLALEALAKSIQLSTEDPLVKAYGLDFISGKNATLANTLNQRFRRIHRKHDQGMRKWELENDFTDRPAKMVHELRLLYWTPKRCTALVLTRSRRMYAKTSVSEESILLERRQDGTWTSYDPLAGTVDKDQLREAIRALLNQQQASGDDFAEEHPDPLSADARRSYMPFRVGNRLYLNFAPYTIAAGAWGTVTIAPAKYAPDDAKAETN